MQTTTAAAAPAQIAKGALRRLAMAKLEPTPENYARAYADEAGTASAQPAASPAHDNKSQGPVWALLIEKLVRGVERSSSQWTPARKKESLQRVLDGSRGDLQRLQQRLQALVGAWDNDRAAESVALVAADDEADADAAADAAASADAAVVQPGSAPDAAASVNAVAASHGAGADPGPQQQAAAGAWQPIVASLEGAVRSALAVEEPRAAELADRLAELAEAVAADGISASRVAEIDAVCQRARRLFGQRHELVEQLGALCVELGHGLAELAEDDSWARGQALALQARLADGVSTRAVRAAAELLADTRLRQQRVRGERNAARDALKALIGQILRELADLGEQTGRFHDSVARHAAAVDGADTLESLAGVVRAMVDESRAVQALVGQAQQRLRAEHGRADELQSRVRALEDELRHLSDEAATDALTQVANRRGLALAFEAETARTANAGTDSPPLAVGLIDIDNFKKLNDTLGHAAGDVALKTLAAAVRERLRPADHLARFGGEEFVVLLPATPAVEAVQVLTRLQRSLTEALFLYEQQEVFVTFSAGVTAWQPGETLQRALERADEGLYEAKRSGKNRTCIG